MSDDLASALFDSSDERPWAVGVVVSVDAAAARVRVSLDGSVVTLRRIAGTYRPGDPVAVVRDPTRSGAGQYVAGVIGPVAAVGPLWRSGTVTVIDAPNSRLTVTVNGVAMVLPHVSGTYTVSAVVAVLLDPAYPEGGLVMGPLGNPPAPPPPPLAPVAPPVPVVPTVATFIAVILPIWSGSWRGIRAAYDRWNASQYGGPSSLYQGSAYGSGPMTGIAVYGDQVAGLGALSIVTMTVDSVLATGAGTPIFQGTAQGTSYPGAPAPFGASAAGSGEVDLTASGIAEEFRVGSMKGLCTVGGDYLAVRGTSLGNGMALRVTYTKAI